MHTVKILGAGPAGLSAAINLAKNDYNVDIFEKNSDVGATVKKNLQGLENWSEKTDTIDEFKKMNIIPDFDFEPFYNLKITNNNEIWDFECERPAFYIVSRGQHDNSLDQALKKQAIDNGVNIMFDKTATGNEMDIIATGPDPEYKFAIGRGLTFKTEQDNIAVGLVNNYHAFKGYSYLLISNGCGCIATVLFEGFNDLNKYFRRTLNMFTGKFDLKMEDPSKITGNGSFSSQILKNKDKIYVGETAGLQDFLWGFGIKNAIKSGFIAANNIIEGKDCQDYYRSVENYFKPKLNAGIVNRFFWEKLGSNNYSYILNRISNAEDPVKYLRSVYNFNFLQKLDYPLASLYIKYRYPYLKI